MKSVRHAGTAIVGLGSALYLGITTALPASADPISPQAELRVSTSNPIPFDPPIVHPGLAPGGPLAQSPKAPKFTGVMRDLMFHPSDRQVFQAMHPFLLHKPQTVPVTQSPGQSQKPAPKTNDRKNGFSFYQLHN